MRAVRRVRSSMSESLIFKDCKLEVFDQMEEKDQVSADVKLAGMARNKVIDTNRSRYVLGFSHYACDFRLLWRLIRFWLRLLRFIGWRLFYLD